MNIKCDSHLSISLQAINELNHIEWHNHVFLPSLHSLDRKKIETRVKALSVTQSQEKKSKIATN